MKEIKKERETIKKRKREIDLFLSKNNKHFLSITLLNAQNYFIRHLHQYFINDE